VSGPPTLEVDAETVDQITAFVRGTPPPSRRRLEGPAHHDHLPGVEAASGRLPADRVSPPPASTSPTALRVREGWPVERGLALWTAYNERLLGQLERERQDVSWFDFEAPEAELLGTVQALCESLGLRFERSAAEGFNPFLRHHNNPESIPDLRIKALYDRLRDRAASGSLRPRTVAARPAVSGWSLGPRNWPPGTRSRRKQAWRFRSRSCAACCCPEGKRRFEGRGRQAGGPARRSLHRPGEPAFPVGPGSAGTGRAAASKRCCVKYTWGRQTRPMISTFRNQLAGLRQESRQQFVDAFGRVARTRSPSVGQADRQCTSNSKSSSRACGRSFVNSSRTHLPDCANISPWSGWADRQRTDLESAACAGRVCSPSGNQRVQELQTRLAAAEGVAERLQAECQGLRATRQFCAREMTPWNRPLREQAETAYRP